MLSTSFAVEIEKVITPWVNHFGKRTDWSLISFLIVMRTGWPLTSWPQLALRPWYPEWKSYKFLNMEKLLYYSFKYNFGDVNSPKEASQLKTWCSLLSSLLLLPIDSVVTGQVLPDSCNNRQVAIHQIDTYILKDFSLVTNFEPHDLR